jgi:hypothetical protein
MRPQEIVYFGATLFLALVALVKWKRRRDLAAERVNRGLRGYVAAEVTLDHPKADETREETQGENLIPIP